MTDSKQNNPKIPASDACIRVLFYLNGIFWLGTGLNGFIMNDGAFGLPKELSWIISLLMVANGLILVWLGWQVPCNKRAATYTGIGYTAINAVLSITDQAGILDYVVLALNLVLLALLVARLAPIVTNPDR